MTTLVLCLVAAGAPKMDVMKGTDLYFEGRYNRALKVLNRALEKPKLPVELRVEALKYKAFSLFVTNRRSEAKETWLELIGLQPGFRLDPMDASPELAEFFNGVGPVTETKPPEPEPEPRKEEPRREPGFELAWKAEPKAEPKTEPPVVAEVRPEEPEKEIVEAPVDLEANAAAAVTDGCAPWLCAIPFGVGQFVNGNYVRGGIFAGTQALFLSLNIGFYWSNRLEYEREGRFANSDAADRLHVMQHVFLGLFAASVVGGVVDAYLFP